MFIDEFLSTEVVTMIVDEDVEPRSVSVEERVAHCRQIYGGFFDPQHGKWRSIPYACGRWRLCPLCLADRATVEHQKIALCYEHGLDLRYVALPPTDAEELCRALGKKNFRRYPGELDHVFFISPEDETDSIGREVDDELLSSLDWQAIVFTPDGRKLSGSLGFVAPGAGATAQKIKVECVVSDASPELRQQAVEYAINKTKSLNPKTLAEVVIAIYQRTHEYKAFLVANEATLYPSRSVAVSVEVESLDWQVTGYWADVQIEAG